MPIATPDVYAAMLDKAKDEQFAYPAINVSSSQTLHAAMRGFAEAGSATASCRCRPGARSSSPARRSRTWSRGPWPLRRSPQEAAKKYPVNIALHTDHCPKDKLDGFVRPLLEVSQGARRQGRAAGVPVAHVGRLGGAARGEPLDREGAAGQGRRGQDRARDRGRRRRWRRGRRRGRHGRQALLHARGRARDRGGARARRERSLPDGADVRQRARRLQARQRQAAAGDPAGRAGGGGGEATAWATTVEAVRPGLPRRVRLAARGDPRGRSTTA